MLRQRKHLHKMLDLYRCVNRYTHYIVTQMHSDEHVAAYVHVTVIKSRGCGTRLAHVSSYILKYY